MAERKFVSPVGGTTRASGVAEKLISVIVENSAWVRDRYSLPRLRACLRKWQRAVRAGATEVGLELTDEQVFRHFRVSYLRMLSSRSRRRELQQRVSLAINRSRKDRLLAKAGIDPNSADPRARAWRQRSVEVIEERLNLWEERLRESIPELSERVLYKYLRQRYFQVPLEKFKEIEIKKGIRNARNHIRKRVGLAQLRIDCTHPQWESWDRMQFWEFERKASKLSRAIEACKTLSLKFPPCGEMNTREYNKFLNPHVKTDRPTVQEEMLYKLILYFEGMTRNQLECIKEDYLTTEDWQWVDLRTCLNHLVSLKLLGVVESETEPKDKYYTGRKQYLWRKVEACRNGSLEFARDVDQAELDEYLRWVSNHGEDGIGTQERLLLKLISHYGLVGHGELKTLYSKYISRNGGRSIWSKSTPRTYLTRLIDLELVEVIGRSGKVVKEFDPNCTPDGFRYRVHRGFLAN